MAGALPLPGLLHPGHGQHPDDVHHHPCQDPGAEKGPTEDEVHTAGQVLLVAQEGQELGEREI